MTIYNNFKPTWLMIKRHKTTGLLYFCKTTIRDPDTYLGSGEYWKKHIKKHGQGVETLWKCFFENKDDLMDFAIFFSEFFNIVDDRNKFNNKIWANLEIENGINGMPVGTDRGKEFKEKSKINNTGCKNPSYGIYWWNNGVDEIKNKICPDGWVRGRSPILKQKVSTTIKLSDNRSGKNNNMYGKKWWTNGTDSIKSYVCPSGWYRGVGSEFRKKCSNKLK